MELRYTRSVLAALILIVGASGAQSQTGLPGTVNFARRADSGLDNYTNSPSTAQQQWFQTNFTRMGVSTPYFDYRTSWYSNAQFYQDLYAIYSGSAIASQHPEWILHDPNGNLMYIPWNCSNGTCPQYAADIANPNFRAWWIAQAQSVFSQGNYKGIWVDDVNMAFNVCDGWGNLVAPIDDATGAPMTWTAWRNYIAQFVTQIRQAFPTKEILHNSVWYSGPAGIRDLDPAIVAQIAAADVLNIERGIGSDPGLTGGTGDWSLYSLFGYIDRVHQAGRNVVLEQLNVTDTATRQYSMAGYFLVSSGKDYYGDLATTPDNWWSGFNVNIGSPLGARTYNNGIYQRNFSQGMVLLGEPGAATQTITLPATFKTIDGTSVSSVTISASQGIVLLGAYPNPVPPAVSLTTPALSAATVAAAYNVSLSASGGSGTYTFSATGLPTGLAINGSSITGTPGTGTAGTYSNVVITAKDPTTGASAQKTYSLTVYAAIAVTTSSLPSGTVGSSYTANVAASGGSGSYTWSVTNQPAGLAISGNTLVGMPSTTGTASSVLLTVTDTLTSLAAPKTLSITILALPTITTSSLPSGTVGQPYSASLTASGGSGTFTWSATGLPPGIVVAGSGLSGTPTTAATYSSVAVKLTDTSTGLTAQTTLSITVSNPLAPSVSLNPTGLTFVSQTVGTTSAAQVVALTNQGTAPLLISSVILTGTNAGDFNLSNPCPSSLAAGAVCNISVSFKPSASGTRTASLTVADNAPASPQTIAVSGTGAAVVSTITAAFVKADSTTQGNWRTGYGIDGYQLMGDLTKNPTYAAPAATGQTSYTWASSSTDIRALQKASATDRIAAAWYAASSLTIDSNITDLAPHQVALYLLDWDSTSRREKVDVLDNSGNVLNTQTLSTSFNGGVYLVWNVTGHVKFRVTLSAGANAVVSGMFFGGAATSATFVKADTATQGNWRGVYGADGYNVVNDGAANPTYATVFLTGLASYSWAGSTSDARALQKPSNTSDRIASCWYTSTSYIIDSGITDQAQHQVALYVLDWDSTARQQRVDVIDAAGTVVNTQLISSFNGGVYLVWNVTGHVRFRVSAVAGANAVVSGIFFR